MATRALLYRRPAEPATLLVKHGSQVFAIRLRRHRRARRYTLRIHPTDREAILTMALSSSVTWMRPLSPTVRSGVTMLSMQAYLWVRALGESMIREAELTATIVRPWYVLGPGRRWPKMILPLYKLAEAFAATRPTAERLGLVTIEQFVKAMVGAAENPPASGRQRIVDVPAIKSARL